MNLDTFGEDDSLPVETDVFILLGHPYTCNGGNPNFAMHHNHRVLLVREDDHLACPECGRTQPLKRLPRKGESW